MNRKLSIGILGILIFGVLGSLTVLETNAQTPTTAKIGLLTPKTGALGFLGQSFEDAANLAIDALNDMQDDYEFELVVGDTETDNTATVTAMNALVAAGVSGVVGAAASGNTLAAIAIASDNEIPMISYASTSPAITDAEDDDYLFRVVPSDAFQGQATAALASHEGMTNVAVIALNDAYGQGLQASFEGAFDGDVATSQSYPSDQDDFTSIVTAVKNSDADGVLLISFNTDGVLILDELAAQSVDLPIIGTDGIKSAGVFNASTFVGVKGTAPLVNVDETFAATFNATYEYEPSIFVPETYDATMIIGQAVIEADSVAGADVKAELRTIGTDYDGVSGTISFDENGDQIAAAFEFWEAIDGEDFDRIGDFTNGVADFYNDVTTSTTQSSSSSSSSDSPLQLSAILMAISSIAVVVSFRRRLRN